MTTTQVNSLAEVKARLSELVALVGSQHERVTVTVHRRPAAVLLAVDDLESLEEPNLSTVGHLSIACNGHADAEIARGEAEDERSLSAAMAARRSGG